MKQRGSEEDSTTKRNTQSVTSRHSFGGTSSQNLSKNEAYVKELNNRSNVQKEIYGSNRNKSSRHEQSNRSRSPRDSNRDRNRSSGYGRESYRDSTRTKNDSSRDNYRENRSRSDTRDSNAYRDSNHSSLNYNRSAKDRLTIPAKDRLGPKQLDLKERLGPKTNAKERLGERIFVDNQITSMQVSGFRGGGRGGRGASSFRGTGRSGGVGRETYKKPAADEDSLDKEMDSYMKHTKSFLDNDLDDYMNAKNHGKSITNKTDQNGVPNSADSDINTNEDRNGEINSEIAAK